MKTLIPMVDFVMKSFNKLKVTDLEIVIEYLSICKYGEFLKQPLTLGMFVTVDEKRNILKKPKGVKCCAGISNDCDYHGELQYDSEEIFKYQEAMEKVLFKGDWKVTNYKGWNLVEGNGKSISFYPWESDCLTIENLIGSDFELTESALKQIGIKNE